MLSAHQLLRLAPGSFDQVRAIPQRSRSAATTLDCWMARDAAHQPRSKSVYRKCIELAPEPKARVMRLHEWADTV